MRACVCVRACVRAGGDWGGGLRLGLKTHPGCAGQGRWSGQSYLVWIRRGLPCRQDQEGCRESLTTPSRAPSHSACVSTKSGCQSPRRASQQLPARSSRCRQAPSPAGRSAQANERSGDTVRPASEMWRQRIDEAGVAKLAVGLYSGAARPTTTPAPSERGRPVLVGGARNPYGVGRS